MFGAKSHIKSSGQVTSHVQRSSAPSSKTGVLGQVLQSRACSVCVSTRRRRLSSSTASVRQENGAELGPARSASQAGTPAALGGAPAAAGAASGQLRRAFAKLDSAPARRRAVDGLTCHMHPCRSCTTSRLAGKLAHSTLAPSIFYPNTICPFLHWCALRCPGQQAAE